MNLPNQFIGGRIKADSRTQVSVSMMIAITLLAWGNVGAQNREEIDFTPKLRGAIMMANSHIPAATEGGKTVSVIPTWGMDLDYFFHSRWSVAMQLDIKLQSFEIKDNGAELQRSYPFSIAPLIHYHLLHHWSFYTGPGYELESHRNLFIFKFGSEYSFEVTENFEIALNLIYENRQEIYDGVTFGIAFNKRLWPKD